MIRAVLFSCLAGSFFFSTFASANPFDYYARRMLRQHHAFVEQSLLVTKAHSYQQATFDQRINHDDPTDTRTFAQRYYVDETYASGTNPPVVFYVCGEAACEFSEVQSSTQNIASELKAVVIGLEHRYYGPSQPFSSLTTENLQYLSIDQALEDIAAFQDFIDSTKSYSKKWLVMGGSYPGTLSAYFREQYPQRTVGSLASSAPVRAKESFEEYDGYVTKVVGPTCAQAMRNVVTQVENSLGDATAVQNIKAMFQVPQLQDNDDLLMLLADVGATAAQYGFQTEFCADLQSSKPLQGYANFAQKVYQLFQVSPIDMTIQGTFSTDPKDYPTLGMRAWQYQACTQYGFDQIANPDPSQSVRSARLDLAYFRGVCQRAFGLTTPPAIDATNQRYYEPLFNAVTDHILFTNGSDDPWSTLGLTTPQSLQGNAGLTTYVIQGGSHCTDLYPTSSGDSSSLQGARQLFLNLATGWMQAP